jgi:hypothetical protein
MDEKKDSIIAFSRADAARPIEPSRPARSSRCRDDQFVELQARLTRNAEEA